MIKNLIVNGCSFTELAKDSDTPTWSETVLAHLNVDLYKNIAMGAAGNKYIAHSTIDLLEHERLTPEETLVLIMWSGLSRKDRAVSKDWWNYAQASGYPFGAQHVLGDLPNEEYTYWIFSGGMANSWNYNNVAKELFLTDYKTSSAEIMCKESLFYFKYLEDYLTLNKYRFKFTSFINYWIDGAIIKHGEFAMGHYCKHVPLYQNFDFSNWVFIDNEKNSFGELAKDMNQLDHTQHPTVIAHKYYAKEFIIPALKEIL